MRIFATGGTGSIGSAVVRNLVERGHEVTGLARSSSSASALRRLGASALSGDIRRPEAWLAHLPDIDGVVHMATDFASDMGEVDTHLLDQLLPVLGAMGKPRFVYTGGCWLYGPTGAESATETSPFDPLPAFAWMVPNLRRVLQATEVCGLVIHPAMVYDRSGGVFSSFLDHARAGSPVPVVGGAHVRWPIVHTDDLAQLYALVLEQGTAGRSYNGAAIAGLPVGPIASAIAKHWGGPDGAIRIVSADDVAARRGEWARGYAMDQSMSGDRAGHELNWQPLHLDPLADLLSDGSNSAEASCSQT